MEGQSELANGQNSNSAVRAISILPTLKTSRRPPPEQTNRQNLRKVDTLTPTSQLEKQNPLSHPHTEGQRTTMKRHQHPLKLAESTSRVISNQASISARQEHSILVQ